MIRFYPEQDFKDSGAKTRKYYDNLGELADSLVLNLAKTYPKVRMRRSDIKYEPSTEVDKNNNTMYNVLFKKTNPPTLVGKCVMEARNEPSA
jgi:hypothetical protein